MKKQCDQNVSKKFLILIHADTGNYMQINNLRIFP